MPITKPINYIYIMSNKYYDGSEKDSTKNSGKATPKTKVRTGAKVGGALAGIATLVVGVTKLINNLTNK